MANFAGTCTSDNKGLLLLLLLAIATNIPVLLMLGFVIQGRILFLFN